MISALEELPAGSYCKKIDGEPTHDTYQIYDLTGKCWGLARS